MVGFMQMGLQDEFVVLSSFIYVPAGCNVFSALPVAPQRIFFNKK